MKKRSVIKASFLTLAALLLCGLATSALASNPQEIVSNDGQHLSLPKDIFLSDLGAGAMVSEPWAGEDEDSAAVDPMTVIGADGRTRVYTTTTYPSRSVVYLSFKQSGVSKWCTGFMIGPNTVATMGGCVHTGGAGGVWSTNVVVYPGKNGSVNPYGGITAKKLYSVTGWVSSKSEFYNYGAIKLNSNIGTTVGWFGFAWTASSQTGWPTTIIGYPFDKAPVPSQWKSVDYFRYRTTSQLFYWNDTVSGMVGGPLYRYYNPGSGSGYYALAIHTDGLHGSPPYSTYNHGVRVNQSVFNNLLYWKGLP